MTPKSAETIKSTQGKDRWVVVLFGLFLGLCILKFGNPIILDQLIEPPSEIADWFKQAWPLRWAFPLLLMVGVSGLIFAQPMARIRESGVPCWILLAPFIWLGWQFIAGERSVDSNLSGLTLRHFSGCVTCFAVGFLVLSPWIRRGWLWVGILIGFFFCLNKAAHQSLFEFRQDYQALVEGEAAGWTNFDFTLVERMRQDHLIVLTNGVEIANPAILDKMKRARVSGTLVYPNALAGLILMLLPATIAFLNHAARKMKPSIHRMVLGLALFLGLSGFYWTGSKAGWLIALLVGVILLMNRSWSPRVRGLLILTFLLGGLGVFGLRFSGNLARGSTSARARFDYWRSAIQNTVENPVFGSGPGTFQRPYARMKLPGAEMARLVHNDYLEQASDSGVLGLVFYGLWIFGTLQILYRRFAKVGLSDPIPIALFYGLLAWFLQGFFEFGLYIPAVAWTAFALMGALLGLRPAQAKCS